MFLTLIFILMTQNNNPVNLIIMLVIYTLSISMFMSLMTCKYIFSIILYLMMISGLLIIFLYFTSLINNEQNNWKNNYLLMTIFFMNMMTLWYLTSHSKKISMYPTILMTNPSLYITKINENNNFQTITYIYSYPFNIITILSILFLLLTLFIIIKICLLKMKPLRKIK
uniref:NADH dehydrogenase subunit 6 n=1 Tax=Aphaenogaster japonica TaxID=602661 RepID=UPI001EDE9CD0|nr:NADH dehydrogenase subunit 6 [Aphaenogaster japonica]UHY39322.1 NADH dehydrogenase subunit 6 [Aphaenogaster japonica]